MRRFNKINNTKKSRIFWIISGLLTILDGFSKILSFGFYNSNFNINYLTNSRKNE
jgi:hypothetical protein